MPCCTAAVGTTDGVLVDAERQIGDHGQARPQLFVLVGEAGLQPDGAGRGVDLVVDDLQHAGRQRLAVGDLGLDLRLARAHQRIDLADLLLRRGEHARRSAAIRSMTTMPVCWLAATMLPSSTSRKPTRPVSGAVIRV